MNKVLSSKPIRKIQVSNFGALGNITLTLNKSLQVVIGPQASGKSTLVKSVYFCRKIRDYLTDFTRDIWNGKVQSDLYISFLKYLRNPFMGCFGTTKHMDTFTIKYSYDDKNDRTVTISLGKGSFVNFKFSDSLKKEIVLLLEDALQISNNRLGELAADYYAQRDYLELVKNQVCRIFCDDETLLYIPAGRNMLATIPDIILPESTSRIDFGGVDITKIDLITQDFIHYIQRMRGRFGSKLDEMTKNYSKTVRGEIEYQDVQLACELIRNILKGDYVNDKDGEKLYYNEDKWIKLMFGSSGQQEVLWALNCIYLAILQNEKTFLVFEEPESHIFPDSQQSIAQLVSLMINSTQSEVFLTTHSPYMLTAVNLLLYSGRVEKGNSSTNIVERKYRLDPDEVDAYYILGNKAGIKHLYGEDKILIDAIEIDHVSNRINEKMDELLKIEMNNEEMSNK